jgi:hypothetical protein
MAMAWQRVKSVAEVKPWFLRDAPGFQLIPEVKPLPSEGIFDKITMSAFEGTPLDIALRDCRIEAFAIIGIAMEIGIEPAVRHGADLGYIPVVIKDACGFGHRDAAAHSIASLEFAGDALLTNVETKVHCVTPAGLDMVISSDRSPASRFKLVPAAAPESQSVRLLLVHRRESLRLFLRVHSEGHGRNLPVLRDTRLILPDNLGAFFQRGRHGVALALIGDSIRVGVSPYRIVFAVEFGIYCYLTNFLVESDFIGKFDRAVIGNHLINVACGFIAHKQLGLSHIQLPRACKHIVSSKCSYGKQQQSTQHS